MLFHCSKRLTFIFLINNQTHSTNQQNPIKSALRFLRTYSFQAKYENKTVKTQNLFNKQTLTIYLIECNNFTYNNIIFSRKFINTTTACKWTSGICMSGHRSLCAWNSLKLALKRCRWSCVNTNTIYWTLSGSPNDARIFITRIKRRNSCWFGFPFYSD